MSDDVRVEFDARVRYGRVETNLRWVQQGMNDDGQWVSDRVPKNTLYTIRHDDLIYFGIARCHSRLDTFHKHLGTQIASDRCHLAVEEFLDTTIEDFVVHHSGLRGVVRADSVPVLLEYFDNIDRISLEALNASLEVLNVEAI